MTKLYYPASGDASFTFRKFLNSRSEEYFPDTVHFDRGSWFGDSELAWENREQQGRDLIQPTVLKFLQDDPSSKLILDCGNEIVGSDCITRRCRQFDQWGIDQQRVHFLAASKPQQAQILAESQMKVSVFHHWEMYIAAKTVRWDTDQTPDTKFLYLNRRNSWERLTLAYLLLGDHSFVKNTNYSLHHSIYWGELNRAQELKHFRSVLSQTPEQYRNKITAWLRQTCPWRTIHGDTRNPYHYDIVDSSTEQLFKRHSLHIITESHPYHDFAAFMPTEKTFRVIAASRPFVTLGTQYFLRHLRDMGYRTFSDYWPEDYDLAPDLNTRIHLLADTVKTINTMSTEQIHSCTRAVTEHNRLHLRERTTLKQTRAQLVEELAAITEFDKPQVPD